MAGYTKTVYQANLRGLVLYLLANHSDLMLLFTCLVSPLPPTTEEGGGDHSNLLMEKRMNGSLTLGLFFQHLFYKSNLKSNLKVDPLNGLENKAEVYLKNTFFSLQLYMNLLVMKYSMSRQV